MKTLLLPVAATLVLGLSFGIWGVWRRQQARKNASCSPQRREQAGKNALMDSMTLVSHPDEHGTPVCSFHMKQPYLLLSRDQVRQLHSLLGETLGALRRLYHEQDVSCEGYADETDDLATETLHEKVRFVYRSAQLRFPAIVSATALTLELTSDELQELEIEVMMLAQDLDADDASWFYADSSIYQGIRHLAQKQQCVRQGPVLCGSLPPSGQSWYFVPFFGHPQDQGLPLCPRCVARWNTEQQACSKSVSEHHTGHSFAHGTQQEVWYEL